MSQFKFANDVSNLLNMDGPLTKGPAARWQKTGLENSMANLTLNSSKISTSKSFNGSQARTPKQRSGNDVLRSKKTPKKTPSRAKSSSRGTTPVTKMFKTPVRTPIGVGGGDRFIPARSTTNFELGQFKLAQHMKGRSPMQGTQRHVFETLYGTDIYNQRILSYQVKAPSAPDGFQNPNRVLYTQQQTPSSAKTNARHIPVHPERILDAPDILDDYYLNLVDWSSTNVLAVALGTSVYLWNAATGTIDHLVEVEGNDYICSVNWLQEGNNLAVGTSLGTIELWDTNHTKRLRIMDGHSARVGSLAWNSYILSSGCRSGQIIHHDVRQREHNISTVTGHNQEVCGLRWSPDGSYLASGGNDNVLNIWSVVGSGRYHSQPQPLYRITAHMAAVKALAWCPWQPHILASGGGTADRHIRFWNAHSGTCTNSIDTHSQVCSLLWSSAFKEIASGHGFADNQLIIWKYPSMTKVTELKGHTARVLHLDLSPDGSTILSAGADETLRLWKCFTKNPTKKESGHVKVERSLLKQSIR